MSAGERPHEAYGLALLEQVEQHVASLDELRDLLGRRPLTFIERSATERSLQIVIEAAIGACKHTLRAHGRPVPAEARVAVERVFELLGLRKPSLAEMRGAVGMRNAIVHDYLNLDWTLLERVVAEARYRRVQTFVRILVDGLLGRS